MSHDKAVVEQQSLPARLQSRVRELLPFEDGGSREMFLARLDSSESQFILPARLAELLELLDGSRTMEQVATTLSRNGEVVTVRDVESIVATELLPRNLVGAACDSREAIEKESPPKPRARLDFVFRFPLISQERITPVVDRLKVLFDSRVVWIGLLLSALAHIAFYYQPHASRPIAVTSGNLLLAYLIALLTVVFHEFGHASACHRFDGEHGEIGFCLYLVFPALYVNLSKAWTLPGRKRAVIDIGGIYFQLLLVIPLAMFHLLFHNPSVATVIYAVDAMTLFSLNPFLKCDGYWLLVDLSGVANLQRRALGLVGDCLVWPFRRVCPRLRSFEMEPVQKFIVMTYAALTGLGLATTIPFMILHLPKRFHAIFVAASEIPIAAHNGVTSLALESGKLAMMCMFIPVTIRMCSAIFRKLWLSLKGISWREAVWTKMHLRFVALCTAMLYVATIVQIGIHELGHAVLGRALGAEIPLLQIHAAGGRTIAIFPLDSPAWKTGIMQIGGCGFVFVASLALLPLALRPRRATAGRLFVLYLGIMSGLGTLLSAGLVAPMVAQGEVRAGLAAIGVKPVAQLAIQLTLSCAGLLIGGFFFRRLQDTQTRSEGDGTSSRLAIAAVTWTGPMLLVSGFQVFLLMVSGARSELPAVVIAAIVLASVGLLAAAVRQQQRCTAEPMDFSPKSLIAGASFAALAVFAQVAVFGIDRGHPRGLFLGGPPREVTVAAWNVDIQVGRDQHALVRISMRPFVSSHEFLWHKVRQQDPQDWSVYEKFVAQAVPELVAGRKYTIRDHYNDPKQTFYLDGKISTGARVVEADVVLAAPVATTDGDQVLRVDDFWKKKRIGYMDEIGIEFAPGLRIKRIVTAPERSRPPVRNTETRVAWVNPAYRDAFESSDIVFAETGR